jgi:hypothetical protein
LNFSRFGLTASQVEEEGRDEEECEEDHYREAIQGGAVLQHYKFPCRAANGLIERLRAAPLLWPSTHNY